MTKTNKILLFAFALLLSISVGLFALLSLSINSAFADTPTSVITSDTFKNGITFKDGADIRAKENEDDTGIRFTAYINSDVINALFTDDRNDNGLPTTYKSDNYAFGMIIIPRYVLAKINKITSDYYSQLKAVVVNENSFASNFKFSNFALNDDSNKETYPLIANGAIIGISEKNLKYDYSAVVYFTADGTNYIYSNRYDEVSSTSKGVTLADKANDVLSATDNELQILEDVKKVLVSYIAKTVKVKSGIDYTSSDDAKITFSDEKTFDATSSYTISSLFTQPVSSDLISISTYGEVSVLNGEITSNGIGKANITASLYGGLLNYNYTVYACSSIETDLATGEFGLACANASVTIKNKTYTLDDNGNIVFPLTGDGDARALASDESQIASVVIGGEKYYINLTLWSLFVKNSNISLLKNYEYKKYGYQTSGYFKLVESINLTNYLESNELGVDSTFIGGSGDVESTGTLSRGFGGVFDGNNYSITYNCSSNKVSPIPIFYNIYLGTVKNLTIIEKSGSYTMPLISTYGTGLTIDNVYIKVESNTESINRKPTVVGSLYGGFNCHFTNLTVEYPNVPQTWIIGNAPFITSMTDAVGHVISSRFSATLYLKDILIKFGSGSLSRWMYDAASAPVDFYTKIVGGSAYENVEYIKSENGVPYYSADEKPSVESTEFDNVKFNDNGTERSIVKQYKTIAVGVGETFSFVSVLSSGSSLRLAYEVVTLNSSRAITMTKNKVVTTYQYIEGNQTKYNRVNNSISFSEKGVYNYYVVSTTYETVYLTINVVDSTVITAEYIADLKEGISFNDLVTYCGDNLTESIIMATLGSNTLSISNNAVSFGEVGSMTNATKKLASDTPYVLSFRSQEKVYIFENFKLYSILVSDSEELRMIKSFATSDSTSYAVIGFDEDIDYSGTWTSSNSLASDKAVSGGGFGGVIDGRGHYLANLPTTNALLITSARNCKVKNITFKYTSHDFNGVIARYITGSEISDVTVISNGYTCGNKGLLFGEIYGDNGTEMKLTNITFINNFNAVNASDLDSGQSLIGNIYINSIYYVFKQNIIVNNIVVVTTSNNSNALRLVRYTYRYAKSFEEKVLDLGSGIKTVEGEPGVTYYSSIADYEAGENGIVAQTTSKEVNVSAGTPFDFSEILENGETFDYLISGYASTSGGKACTSNIYQKGASKSKYTFTTAGTYYASVRTTNYHFYTVKVVVS